MFQTLCFFFLLLNNFLRNFLFFYLITTFLDNKHSLVKCWFTSLDLLLFNIFIIWLNTMIFCWSFLCYFSIKLIPKNIFFHCISSYNPIMTMLFQNISCFSWGRWYSSSEILNLLLKMILFIMILKSCNYFSDHV